MLEFKTMCGTKSCCRCCLVAAKILLLLPLQLGYMCYMVFCIRCCCWSYLVFVFPCSPLRATDCATSRAHCTSKLIVLDAEAFTMNPDCHRFTYNLFHCFICPGVAIFERNTNVQCVHVCACISFQYKNIEMITMLSKKSVEV